MTKLLIAVTADISVRLLNGQLEYLAQQGFDVHLVVSKGPSSEALKKNRRITVHHVEMAREISVLKDIKALIQMILVFRKVRPDIANVGTPKAALLGSIAAFLMKTKTRIYTLRGLRMETATGNLRKILWLMEQLIIGLSTQVIAISPSLITKCKELRIQGTSKMRVLGKGSSNGIHLADFAAKSQETIAYPFDNQQFVIGFTGRITKDKGIEELITAFLQSENLNLLLVGDFEEQHGLKKTTVDTIRNHPNIRVTGFIPNPAPYYKMMDVFVIPSYREGFSNVCLEAAVAGLPVIGTDVTGIKDAIVDGVTGILIPAKSATAIQTAIQTLQQDQVLREAYAFNGKKRVILDFQSEHMWQRMKETYLGRGEKNVSAYKTNS
ncbi:glycosyltransferase family 4 protein [Listeria booriae]|uniref:glycosyltransferase family 4 protein n=1 Tax=Listeria booriae TaxID=1552123 RepID=UPI00162A8B16|nr:glycosyltransferase family 4 protein [Listeria booriae]MBC1285420.1 glycosyltransferase family 4 protein [Listeria booriae]MBC1308672.1 glycosyltransferase family 4 protein [Listeria booriae]